MHSESKMEDSVELGGSIVLTGFSELDGASMIILKKIVGRHVKDISEQDVDFKKLEVVLGKTQPYKLTGILTSKKEKKAEYSDNNLFIALGNVLDALRK